MRHLPTFLSIVALLAAAAMTIRFAAVHGDGRLPVIVPTYLVSQCLFALVAWWGLQADSLESPTYMRFFGVAFVLVMFTAVCFAVKLAFVHPAMLGSWLMFATVSLSGCFAAIILLELKKLYGIHTVPPQVQMAVFQGAILLFCGVTSLAALYTELAPALRFSATSLGLFWTTLGLLSLGYSLGIVRRRPVWIHLNNFLPAFLAIVAFAWLAVKLSGLQGELSLESIHPQMRGQECTADGVHWFPARADGICYAADQPTRKGVD